MKTYGWSDKSYWNLCEYRWLKITKGDNWKIMQGRLSFLCATLLLKEIYPPMKFQVDTSNTFWDKLLTKSMKITKGNNSKIMKGRVIILVHCIPPGWDVSTYEVSCWYLKGFLSYALDKDKVRKITKGYNSKLMQGRVIILVQCTPP
jgi:hypothetical protein